MNMLIRKINRLNMMYASMALLTSLVVSLCLTQGVAYADPTTTIVTCKDGTKQTATRSGTSFTTADYEAACKNHGGYQAPTVDTTGSNTGQITPDNFQTGMTVPKGDAAKRTSFSFNGKTTDVTIRDVVIEILKFLSIAVGLAVVGGVAAGGIVYSTAQGSPGKTQAGIKIITNSILALVLYLLMYAMLQFLIPGGVLS